MLVGYLHSRRGLLGSKEGAGCIRKAGEGVGAVGSRPYDNTLWPVEPREDRPDHARIMRQKLAYTKHVVRYTCKAAYSFAASAHDALMQISKGLKEASTLQASSSV